MFNFNRFNRNIYLNCVNWETYSKRLRDELVSIQTRSHFGEKILEKINKEKETCVWSWNKGSD